MSDRSTPERPRAEPEIIPPGQPDPRQRSGEMWMWVSRGSHTREIHLRKPGLFGIIAGALLVGLVIAVIIGIVLSIFLIWIPIVGLILAGLLLASIARGWRRPG